MGRSRSPRKKKAGVIARRKRISAPKKRAGVKKKVPTVVDVVKVKEEEAVAAGDGLVDENGIGVADDGWTLLAEKLMAAGLDDEENVGDDREAVAVRLVDEKPLAGIDLDFDAKPVAEMMFVSDEESIFDDEDEFMYLGNGNGNDKDNKTADTDDGDGATMTACDDGKPIWINIPKPWDWEVQMDVFDNGPLGTEDDPFFVSLLNKNQKPNGQLVALGRMTTLTGNEGPPPQEAKIEYAIVQPTSVQPPEFQVEELVPQTVNRRKSSVRVPPAPTLNSPSEEEIRIRQRMKEHKDQNPNDVNLQSYYEFLRKLPREKMRVVTFHCYFVSCTFRSHDYAEVVRHAENHCWRNKEKLREAALKRKQEKDLAEIAEIKKKLEQDAAAFDLLMQQILIAQQLAAPAPAPDEHEPVNSGASNIEICFVDNEMMLGSGDP